jgi:hypothetical protein
MLRAATDLDPYLTGAMGSPGRDGEDAHRADA